MRHLRNDLELVTRAANRMGVELHPASLVTQKAIIENFDGGLRDALLARSSATGAGGIEGRLQ